MNQRPRRGTQRERAFMRGYRSHWKRRIPRNGFDGRVMPGKWSGVRAQERAFAREHAKRTVGGE